jgi:uncharacterized protein YeaO (DUF488 family)/DNA-binding MarR family transcriptional regulator
VTGGSISLTDDESAGLWQNCDDYIASYCDVIVTRVTLPDAAYGRLLSLRTGLRHFEAWSAKQARAAGLTPAQHQLLLAIRGHADQAGPTIGEAADYLLLRHHSAVGLIDRAEEAGLVYRQRSNEDHRIVRLKLTEDGAARLEALSALHLEELDRLALDLPAAWAGLEPVYREHGFGDAGEEVAAPKHPSSVEVARVYDSELPSGAKVLVDRLWPRGLSKKDAPFLHWLKEVAPSTELRKLYGHRPELFSEFERRYRDELASPAGKAALDALIGLAAGGDLVLLTATKELDLSAAAVLCEVLGQAP